MAVFSTAGAQQPASTQVADEILSIVRAEWAAEIEKNPAEALKNIAEDCPQFTGEYSTRLEGKTLLRRIAEATTRGSQSIVAAEMANPKVQVYGDVAVLSYNFVGVTQDKDGKTEPVRAKSTRVYSRQGGKWMLVHANFAPDPLPR
jgi:ketosteroid isomerase-like protein